MILRDNAVKALRAVTADDPRDSNSDLIDEALETLRTEDVISAGSEVRSLAHVMIMQDAAAKLAGALYAKLNDSDLARGETRSDVASALAAELLDAGRADAYIADAVRAYL